MTKISRKLIKWEVSTTLFRRFLLTRALNVIGTNQIAENIGVDTSNGILEADVKDRQDSFGSNYRPPAEHEPWCSFLKQQLGDTMLIILICAAFVSLILSYLTATPDQYSHGKFSWSNIHTKAPFSTSRSWSVSAANAASLRLNK